MSPSEYLIGLACLLLWLGLLIFSADRLAARLAPDSSGSARSLTTLLLAVGLGLGTAILPGLFGLFGPVGLILTAAVLALVAGLTCRSPRTADRPRGVPTDGAGGIIQVVGLLVGSLAVAVFLVRTLERVGTGMTGFDTTWYHGPIAAEFIESGDVLALHQIAPQFLTWFYPHNSELIHASAGALFGGDLPSLAIGVIWFGGSLLAAWVIGSGRSAGALSLAGVAVVIGSVAFSDQAGEARNDLAGTFFLLAGIGLATMVGARREPIRGAVFLVALAAGLAAGTKLNFLLPGLVLAAGAPFLVESGNRRAAILPAIAGFLAGGAFWYLRNLVMSGNPLPWVSGIGPLGLPGPDQERGGRDPGSVLSYLDDPSVIFDSFLPDLAEGFGQGWPVLLVLAAVGLGLALRKPLDRPMALGAFTGIAVAVAWLVGPTSASGPEGDPVGFLSGLRYLVPGLAIGLALLGPAVAGISRTYARFLAVLILVLAPFALLGDLPPTAFTVLAVIVLTGLVALGALALAPLCRRPIVAVSIGAAALVLLVPFGYLAHERYLENRYTAPEFVAPGLGEAFAWAQRFQGESIGTTATRSYPFYGPLIDNRVSFIGVERPRGGFVRAGTCREFADAVNRDRPDWVVVSLDREGIRRDYPTEVRWLDRDPAAEPVFRNPPTAVFALEGRLDPERCPGA